MGFYPVVSGIEPRWAHEGGCYTRLPKPPITSVLRLRGQGTGNKRNIQTQLKRPFIKIGASIKLQPSKINVGLIGCSEVDCDKRLLS